MPRSQDSDGIGGDRSGRRHGGQEPPVWAAEPKLAVRLSIERVALLVDRAVVPTTEQRQVRERGWASVRPVAEVMPLAEPHATAREAAAAVSVVERPP